MYVCMCILVRGCTSYTLTLYDTHSAYRCIYICHTKLIKAI